MVNGGKGHRLLIGLMAVKDTAWGAEKFKGARVARVARVEGVLWPPADQTAVGLLIS
jgi:hypothetical protein